jgi:AraC family transcriptional regulator
MHMPLDLIAVQLLEAVRCALEGDGLNLRSHIERVAVLVRNSAICGGTDDAASRLPTWRTNRLFSHIESNLSQRIQTEQLARVVGLSQGHLMRVFKHRFGLSIRVYINCRRIAMAQSLMLSTNEPLVEISLRCGMYDQAHFTRTFRKLVGETPSRWREKSRSIVSHGNPLADTTDELLQRYDSVQGTVDWSALRGALSHAEVSRGLSHSARSL